jgi:S1-C subfamily serine protease
MFFTIADQQQVHGAMITMVVPTSPAAEGGLRRYDVVTEMKVCCMLNNV